MKILVVCQYYDPEPFRIGDICRALKERGHQVTVVTGQPNYPEGEIYPGYEKKNRRHEVLDGVKVHRCFTMPRKSGVLHRFLNYYSFMLSSCRFVKKLPGDYDVVLVNQLSPVMMAKAGILYGRKHKKKVVLYCLDLWPESLIAGGIGRSSPIYKFFHRVSRNIYTKMDKILVTSREFTGYLQQQFGIPEEKIQYLPQYAEGLFDALPEVSREKHLNLTFAGNIGEVQSVETILQAARQLQDKPIAFHVVGGGSDLERLQKLAADWKLKNVVFYGRRPVYEMPEFYAKADAMLVTLKADPVLSLTLPGKVQSCMAAGKPIIGAVDGETARVIEEAGCGFCGRAEDAQQLAQNILRFMEADKVQMGQNARNYYEQQFEKSKFIDTLENELKG
jgi:glycosyltransferase involved in cell wall biosynthesis